MEKNNISILLVAASLIFLYLAYGEYSDGVDYSEEAASQVVHLDEVKEAYAQLKKIPILEKVDDIKDVYFNLNDDFSLYSRTSLGNSNYSLDLLYSSPTSSNRIFPAMDTVKAKLSISPATRNTDTSIAELKRVINILRHYKVIYKSISVGADIKVSAEVFSKYERKVK